MVQLRLHLVAEMGFESRMSYLLFCDRIRKITQYAAVATADIDPDAFCACA